jgi:prepilin-type N-terminal cleavage/methylation domain-containing protein
MRKNFVTKRHASRGMSLVELLMVMAILSVVMMAVISLYVPIHQSTVAQTQVSDVQDNLRLALKTMTRDLLIAGFLMPYDPVIFPDATPSDFHAVNLDSPGFVVTDPSSFDRSNFIIRTRSVGNAFARVSSVAPGTVSGADFKLTVADAEMVESFPVGSKVRLFEPVAGNEIKNITDPDTDARKRVYTVKGLGVNSIEIDGNPPDGYLLLSDIPEETVMIRVKDVDTPALQTIQYSLSDGALKRIVNEDVQFLARNVDSDPLSSNFDYNVNAEGRINRIDIKLTGKTKALKDDAISGEKSRAIQTSVKLRNIN